MVNARRMSHEPTTWYIECETETEIYHFYYYEGETPNLTELCIPTEFHDAVMTKLHSLPEAEMELSQAEWYEELNTEYFSQR